MIAHRSQDKSKLTVKKDEAKEQAEIEKIVQMFSDELQQAIRAQRGGRSSSRRGKKIPRDIQEKIGEAHNLFAFNKLDEAIKLFEEVYKRMPDLPDVTHTLSMIYNTKGDLEKSFLYALVSANDTRTDSDKWKQCAEISLEL